VIAARSAGRPVISVDTNEKELIGNFKNGGTDYRPTHGVCDPNANAGWISVGITHDTAERGAGDPTWLDRIGRARYTGMRELMIMADSGGSNSVRSRLWKVELQKLADEIKPVAWASWGPATLGLFEEAAHPAIQRASHRAAPSVGEERRPPGAGAGPHQPPPCG
jgi:DDE family transposase